MDRMGTPPPPSRSLGNRRSQRNALTPASTTGNDSDVGEDELAAHILALESVLGPVLPSGGRSGSSDGIEEDQTRTAGQKNKRTTTSIAAQGVFPPAPHAGEIADEADDEMDNDEPHLQPGMALVAAAQPDHDALVPAAQAGSDDGEIIMDDQEDDQDQLDEEQFAALTAACAIEADVRLNRVPAAAQQDADAIPALEAALPVGDVVVMHNVSHDADGIVDTFHTAMDVNDLQRERIQQLQD